MYHNKVEICGVNTATLPVLSDAEKRELLLKARKGDMGAREDLIYGNLRLVLSIVGRFSGRRESMDDLFQVGCIGLIKSIDNFNVELDVKFSTYAVPMIIGEIKRYLRDNNAIRVSRSVRDLAYRALQIRDAAMKEKGVEPTVEEIATALGEDKKAVAHAMEAIVEPVSLYDSVYNDGEDSVFVIDQIESGNTEEDWIEDISLKEALKKLGERERNILVMRFYKGKTQMEIAEAIGISQAQVSRLEKGALAKVKRLL
ncbi:MAG: RNA polymerase sporulation sigma factor SigG [Clostridia bacterium]|nr:RNA polymerase sporulation sigma factor SigG [Clostridia bacterium]MBO5754721.1 RNA polymerase sporulation sigma factor SigG [Clostridia bacterium]